MYYKKVLKTVLLSFMIVILCTSCKDKNKNPDPETKADSSSATAVSAEAVIENPGEISDTILYFNSISQTDLFEIVCTSMNEQTGVNVYTKYFYKDGKWTEVKSPINIPTGMPTIYRDKLSGKLYGMETINTVLSRDGEENTQDLSTRIELYEISDHGGVTKYIVNDLENMDALHWFGIYKDMYAVFYELQKKQLLEYDYKDKKVKKTWKKQEIQSLCICEDRMYAVNSEGTTELTIYKADKDRPEKIGLPQIKTALEIEVLEKDLFILAGDGIYQGRVGTEDNFLQITDNSQYNLTDYYLLDYEVIKEGDEYVHYIITMNDDSQYKIFRVKTDK